MAAEGAQVTVGTVLVVDDNSENRALAQDTLEEEGITVVLASNGAQGLAQLLLTRPDVILLDIKMPGMTGIEVCERIRAMPEGAHVPILFVTAQRDVETFDRALAAGGDDFITKPFRPGELVVRIQIALRLRRLAQEQDELSRQLKRRSDELQRLQLQKEALSAFLVHDLKNPVNSIELCAQRILHNKSVDDRARDAASRIHDETRGLLRMIMNLLDVAKADEGRLAPARDPIEVAPLVEAAVEEMRLRAQTSGMSVDHEVAPDTGEVPGDRELLRRVLVNLIDNGLRHSPDGGALRVVATRAPDEVIVKVIDRGSGVPPELRERVFDRDVTTGSQVNRGLGLAFCKAVMHAHGGRIWIEDAEPGACFCIGIPDAR